ncbi:MAG: trehalose-phosphatase [Anaerolineales bacterium]|jgi:trehalose 6-phosphate phosphatase
MPIDLPNLPEALRTAGRLALFLDYDGTLAPFAPTPDTILPDPEVIRRVQALGQNPGIQVIVLSGRRLKHIQELLPVPGIWLAGTYGVELLTPSGARLERLPFDQLRPTLDRLRPQWEKLLHERTGFYLEDKGWSLALHARFAEAVEAQAVLARARRQAARAALNGSFQILGGDRFLEIAPQLANKAKTVRYFLEDPVLSGALPVYLGDDDKDEAAFAVVQAAGGVAVKVGSRPETSVAAVRLHDPLAARAWLDALLAARAT